MKNLLMMLVIVYASILDANAQQTTSYQFPDNPLNQVNVNVFVKDNYTGQPLDSAFAKITRNNITLDSGYTNSSGNVLLRFIPLSKNDRQDVLPKAFDLSPTYPNPAEKKVSTLVAVPSPGTLEYTLYDVLGKKVYEGKEEVNPGHYQLSLHQLNNLVQGIYFLQAIHNNEQRVVVKLAKVGNTNAQSSRNLEASLQTAHEFLPLYNQSSTTSMHKEHLLNNLVLSVSKLKYASVNQNHIITRDTSFTVGLLRQNTVTLANLYPNNQPVPNAMIRVNNQTNYTANSQGIIELVLPSGQHRITSIDSRTTLDTLLTIISDTLASVNHNEKISFPWNPQIINEDDSLQVHPNAVNFGTSGTFTIESLNPSLDVKQYNGNYWLVPKKDKNGLMQFKILANAVNSTTGQATKTLTVRPMTDVVLKLVDNDVDSVTLPAYVKIGNDSLFSRNATFSFQFPGGQTHSITAGFTRKDNTQIPWSYKRIFEITTPTNGNDLDTLTHAAVSYYLRDLQGNIVDSFYVAGVSPPSDSTKMSPARFKEFLRWCHFGAGYSTIGGGGGGAHFGTLNRWSNSANGFTPDSIVIFMHTRTPIGGGNYAMSNMEQIVVNRFNELYAQWFIPLLRGRHPPIKLNYTIYTRGPAPVGPQYNWINFHSDGRDQFPYASVGIYGLYPSTMIYSVVTIRSGGPNWNHPPEPILTRALLQEFYNCLIYNSARGPAEPVAGPGETIINDNTYLTEPTKYDFKAARLIHNEKFLTGTSIHHILGL